MIPRLTSHSRVLLWFIFIMIADIFLCYKTIDSHDDIEQEGQDRGDDGDVDGVEEKGQPILCVLDRPTLEHDDECEGERGPYPEHYLARAPGALAVNQEKQADKQGNRQLKCKAEEGAKKAGRNAEQVEPYHEDRAQAV